MAESNPNGANQHKADPRQALFLSYYLDQKSETFSNCFQSAIKAGYEEEYAKVLVASMPTWLSEKLKDNEIVKKAEKNLEEFLQKDGDDPVDKKIKADMTKFALERLNKSKYSARQELAGINNSQLLPTQIEIVEVKQ